jgi:hypothetical protein
MTKIKEVNDGVPVETTFTGNLEETVDVEAARIAAEKRSDLGGFTGADGGHGRSSHDAEEGRWEVIFWHVFAMSCNILVFC